VRLVHALRSEIPDAATWRIVACSCDLCAGGRHVAVNEPSHADGYPSPEARPKWRHISYTSLEAVKAPAKDDEQPPTPRKTGP
jgi:hypothetical protein